MAEKIKIERCPLCEEGRMIPSADLSYKFRYGPHEYVVGGLQQATCDKCGTSGYLPGQLAHNKARINEYQKSLVKIISPSEIFELRSKHGLSQAQAAQIFGGGANAFSKWERGEVIPTESAAKLLKLALESEDIMNKLATEANVKLKADDELTVLLSHESSEFKGWIVQRNFRCAPDKNHPVSFVCLAEIDRECVLNDGIYSDENEPVAA